MKISYIFFESAFLKITKSKITSSKAIKETPIGDCSSIYSAGSKKKEKEEEEEREKDILDKKYNEMPLFNVRCRERKIDKEQAKKDIEEYLGMNKDEKEKKEEKKKNCRNKKKAKKKTEEDIKRDNEEEWRHFVEHWNKTPSDDG